MHPSGSNVFPNHAFFKTIHFHAFFKAMHPQVHPLLKPCILQSICMPLRGFHMCMGYPLSAIEGATIFAWVTLNLLLRGYHFSMAYPMSATEGLPSLHGLPYVCYRGATIFAWATLCLLSRGHHFAWATLCLLPKDSEQCATCVCH